MDTFVRFIFEFFDIFVNGLEKVGYGFLEMFNFSKYTKLVFDYRESFDGPEWIFTATAFGILVIFCLLIAFLVYLYIKKFVRNKGGKFSNESLLEELGKLDAQVKRLLKENSELMAMRVSQLGLGEEAEEASLPDGEKPEDASEDEEDVKDTAHRFPKLELIDEKFDGKPIPNYNNTFTLDELIDNFRSFAASKLKLYYDASLLRAFVSGIAVGRLLVLQGISGTGKTSLAYAWGKFVKNDSVIASVQPSWKDKTEFFGYFNEFTKKFTETDALGEVYAASFDDNVHTIILDEMNIARVEYYFAEMLSILEVPVKSEWIVELVTSGWPNDPKRIINGKIQLPANLWYIGTINNDDSTYMVTDKVYDRAMPIDINKKVLPFKSREQDAMNINASYLETLFKEAVVNHKVSDEALEKLEHIDDYVVAHFRVAFGNRILKQLREYTPVYVACGGEELEAIDYFIARKILRKFEQLNIAFIRDEFDPFIAFLNKECGKGVMKECIEFIEIMKKSV